MNYSIHENKDTVLLKIESDKLDIENSRILGSKLDELYAKGYKIIEIDLSAVRVIGSSGIGKLLFFQKKLEGEGRSLKIKSISSELKKTFDLLRISKIFGLDN